MADPKRLFRSKALERMASPERLDELIEITSPKGWAALSGLGLLLVTLVAWGVFGRVPILVNGQGLMMRGHAVLDVSVQSRGRVKEIEVLPGEVVETGDVVAVLDQPELELQIQHKREELADVMGQTAEGDLATAEILANLRSQREDLEKKLASEEELLRERLVTRNVVLATREALAGVGRSVADYERALTSQANRLDTVKRQLSELESTLELAAAVHSPYTGRVLELMADPGNLMLPGSRLLTLEAFDKPIDAVVFIPAGDGKRVRPGMTARVSPTTVKSEEWGYILGEVRSVSEYPVTPEGLRRVLRNDTLVQTLSGSSAPIEVVVELERDPATESGFRWSSSEGPPVEVFSGTLCSASVVVEKKRPISYVIPIFRQALGVH